MRMYDPPHPGGVLRRQWIEPLGVSITQAAKRLGVSRKALSELVNEHTGISPEMAVRLSIALDTSSELWMNMQASYDLWHAEQRRDELTVATLVAPR
ncbi:MAG: HigA family addiction module antitoxin [Spirochaetaceae bacterium]|nr:HigA family addiction module antitoxin [Spirochaetaceae bacterium]